jgi:hypothetical protein
MTTVKTQLHLLAYLTTAVKAIYWSTITIKTHKRSKLKIIGKDNKCTTTIMMTTRTTTTSDIYKNIKNL